MGHFIEKRQMVCVDDEISDPTYIMTGDVPYLGYEQPTHFIDDVEGCYYYSFAVDQGEVLYKRKEL